MNSDQAVPRKQGSLRPSLPEALAAPRGRGRVFQVDRTVSIDDADEFGRMEVDAIAKYLQDAGNDDTDDAGLAVLGLAWVARRMTIDVSAFPKSRESLAIATWCSGTGTRWAERRTSMTSESGGCIEAAAIWIHIDASTGAPVPWGDDFANAYLEAAGDRKVTARLHLPKTPSPTFKDPSAWHFRKTDTDAFDHVNNAAYLAVVEEFGELTGGPCRIEMEWRSPIRHHEPVDVHRSVATHERTFWLCVEGETRAVARISEFSTD